LTHLRQVGRTFFNRQFLPTTIRCRQSVVNILPIQPLENTAYSASNIERPIELRALAHDLLVGMHRMHRNHLEYRHEYQRHDRDLSLSETQSG
jgi:hypothetical protein